MVLGTVVASKSTKFKVGDQAQGMAGTYSFCLTLITLPLDLDRKLTDGNRHTTRDRLGRVPRRQWQGRLKDQVRIPFLGPAFLARSD
jgi:phage protein U